jgi:hypothetical protein
VGRSYQTIILSCGFKKLVELQGSNEDISPIMFCETCDDIVRLILIHNFCVECAPFDTLTIFGMCSKNTYRINLEYKQAGPQFSCFQAKLKQAIVNYVDESQQSQIIITTLHDNFMPFLEESCTTECSIYFYKLPYATCLQRLWIWIPCHLTL